MSKEDLTAEEVELLQRLIRPQAGKIPADEFDLRISLWQKLIVPLNYTAPVTPAKAVE